LKVLVDARLISGVNGGVEQAIIGLADSFSSTSDLEVDFSWLVYKDKSDWLAHHLPMNSEIVELNPPKELSEKAKVFIEKLRESDKLQHIITATRKYGRYRFRITDEPDIVQKIGPDLIHFPLQFGFKTAFPNVYQPHDLQHLHFPEFFSKEELFLRHTGYTKMIQQSTRVIVGNEWTKRDVIGKYPETRDKVDNVPLFPQLLPPAVVNNSADYFSDENRYIFYPAAFWRHKNHYRLLSALAEVRHQGHQINLILSGANLQGNKLIRNRIINLGLKDHVNITGFVSPQELVGLYKGSIGVVIPSLFESASFPAWEAFSLGVPVAAANTTAIPEQVQGAALIFDPLNVSDIAEKILTLEAGGDGIQDLITKGKARVDQFTPQNTAMGFRYSYRRALNLILDEVDIKWKCAGIRF
jgi:glycosyltransferase involved in cell wall biosynthesis